MLRRKTLSLSKAFYTLPWGVHFCQFYRSISDLTDVVLPFIKAGLEGNELCLWIVSEPLSVGLAESELAAVTDVARHKTEGRLEIIGSERWYKHSDFSMAEVLEALVKKQERLATLGFEGIRTAGSAAWLQPDQWSSFCAYEHNVNNNIGRHPAKVLCSYWLRQCGAPEMIDVLSNHSHAIVKRGSNWEIMESCRWQETVDHFAKKNAEINRLTQTLEKAKSALELLLEKRASGEKAVQEMVASHVENLVFPYIRKLKRTRLDDRQKACLEACEESLKKLGSSRSAALSSAIVGLSPTELRIADLIEQGKTSKEIAQMLNLSPNTIISHRYSIRKKLGIKNRNVNFRSYLLSLQK
jgi:DNA-binding CsgD family transcriptional regulator